MISVCLYLICSLHNICQRHRVGVQGYLLLTSAFTFESLSPARNLKTSGVRG